MMKNIQIEIDASYLYKLLAEKETNHTLISIYKEMAEIEQSHAMAFASKNNILQLPKPSSRVRMLKFLSGVFGSKIILDSLLNLEQNLATSVVKYKTKNNIPIQNMDTNHVTILQNILKNAQSFDTEYISMFEKKHRNIGGNAIRAAVLGANDGLVSNFSLVMGIAGAVSAEQSILLTGLAGLMAGALSMALGEWISVKSSQELYENQIQLELDELEHNPEGERQELILIYKAKGMNKKQAETYVDTLMKDKENVQEVLIKEELGINTEELKGSALEAALYSFVFFAIGAIIPVLPYFLLQGRVVLYASVSASVVGLFLIGASITLFTAKNVWYSGLRQVIFGLIAAAITYCIGSLIGVQITG